MKQEDFTGITERCFHGEPASCSSACPFGLDIRNFMERARAGRWGLAYKILRNAVVFPQVVCEICSAPCEGECQRAQLGDEPVYVRGVEAAAVRYASERSKAPESYRIPPKKEKIAVIGAGPAGLSCALNLAQKKYPVTVFERNGKIGGSLADHPKAADFAGDFNLQFSSVEAIFRLGEEVKSLRDMEGYDAVYVATGKGGHDFGGPSRQPGGPAVFIGGGVIGEDTMQAIAGGAGISREMEVFFQTGRMGGAIEGESAERKPSAVHYVDHTGEPRAPRVSPADGSAYTADEALAEAGRCMLCDCTACLDACEMLRSYSKWPQKIAVEAYVDIKSNPPFSSRSQSRETYSCSMCGLCASVCPEGIDMGKLFMLSREGRRDSGKYPYAFHEFWLRDMGFAADEAAYAAPPPGRRISGYVFFPGCKLASSGRHGVGRATLAARSMLEEYGAGIVLDCCGAPAFWAGERKICETHTAKLRGIWEDLGNPTFIFACAYCEKVFAKLLPEIRRVSVYELLARTGGPAVAPGRHTQGTAAFETVPTAADASAFAVFDPCAARDNQPMAEAVRLLARRTGADVHELSERNRCCGWGGHMGTANPELRGSVLDRRAALSEKPYLVYCANCEDAFLRKGKECAHILDLVLGDGYPAEDDVNDSATIPHLQEKRSRLLALKRELASLYDTPESGCGVPKFGGQHLVDGEEDMMEKDIDLRIPDDVRTHMDSRLILDDDVKDTVMAAESSGDKFTDSGSGRWLASLTKSNITYWVEYEVDEGGAYDVYNVYSHRMRFEMD
ncbi:MAG: NAD(P)-binding protein [Clostridiales Family XIII bacterium]|jgi:Fe-S oxidoreductase|nr:NAD(P)-binding protein [Clostridiales Family XIII bacterium]